MMPGIGGNNFFLDLHGMLMVLALVFSVFIFGFIYFVKEDNPKLAGRLKTSSLIAFLSLVMLMITGIIPDMAFSSGANFSGVWNTGLGNYSVHVTDAQIGAFTGPLLFDMMEHISFVVVGLAAVIVYLIWTGAGRVLTDSHLKRSIITLMFLTGTWVLVLGAIGVYLTKILTFPVH